MDENYLIVSDCPTCDQENYPLGALGNLLWYRCRCCGMEYSYELPLTQAQENSTMGS